MTRQNPTGRAGHTSSDTRATTRRDFLKGAAAVAGGALAFPYIVPSSALGKDGAVAPSERIVMGSIGTGGQGRGLLGGFLGAKNTQVVAVCDVDRRHRAEAVSMVNSKYSNNDCKEFNDLRELVAIKDIDAVVVATPDHWHALASVAALDAGKDVYCEKPLANSVYESRKIVEAVKRNNRVLQVGSHERSTPNCRYAAELVRNGRIGKLQTVRVHLPFTEDHIKKARAQKTMPPPEKVPDGFDYDRWLGHTPKVEYTSKRCHFMWRFNLAYGGGEMTDRGAHVIDIGQLAMDADHTGPVEIEAKGVQNPGSIWDAFWDYNFTNKYENGVTMIGSTDEPRGLKFEGTDGWIFVHIHGGKLEASDPKLIEPSVLRSIDNQRKLLKERAGDKAVDLGRSPGHHQDFLNACKSRQQPIAAGGEIGHRTATLCHLNNIAMRLGRKLKWDPQKEQFIGDDEANGWVKPSMRPPYVL